MLSASELASIRNDAANAACDLPCTIQRKTRTSDEMGGASETWTTVATVMAGMKQPTAAQLANYSYVIGDLAAYQVQLPYGTNVQHQDRLLVGGQVLIVQVDLSPQSYNALTTVIASAVR